MAELSKARDAGRLFLGVAFLAGLVGLITCVGHSDPPTEPHFANGKTQVENEAYARAIVAERLRDPKSADWGAIYVRDTANATVVCGSVNAANALGGRTGARSFVVVGDTALFASDLPPAAFREMWVKSCR